MPPCSRIVFSAHGIVFSVLALTPLPLELHGALSMILVLPLRELASCRYLASPTVLRHSHRSVESKSTYVRLFDSCLMVSTVAASGIQSSLTPNLRSLLLRCSSHPHGSMLVTTDKSTLLSTRALVNATTPSSPQRLAISPIVSHILRAILGGVNGLEPYAIAISWLGLNTQSFIPIANLRKISLTTHSKG